MFSRNRFALGVGLLCASAVLLAVAAPAQIAWDNPSGTASYFDWNSGQNSTGLFGSPTLVGGNAFRFSPPAFRADASDGATDSQWDMAQWNVVAHGGFEFTQIRIVERGDYSITGAGPGNVAKVNTHVFANDNLDLFHFTDDFQVLEWNDPGTDNWQIDITLDLSAAFPPWTDLQIQLQNNLLSISGGAGNHSFIQKKLAGVSVDVFVIPEPSGLLLILAGAAAGLRRR